MATKAQTNGVRLALALNKDIIGNWIFGADERCVRYAQLQNELLVAVIADLTERTPQTEANLHRIGLAINQGTHPALADGPPLVKAEGADARAEKVGGLHALLDKVDLPPAAKAMSHAALSAGNRNVRVNLTVEEAQRMFGRPQ